MSKHRGRRTVTLHEDSIPSVQGETVLPPEVLPNAFDIICGRVMEGVDLRTICKEENMPSYRQVSLWLRDDPGFRQRYFDAQRIFLLGESSRLVQIADGEMTTRAVTKDGDEVFYVEDVPRSKLRIDTRLKLLSKFEPVVFGDKIDVNHGVNSELMQILANASNKGHRLPSEIE